jgi:hypothetical protein
VTRRLQVLFLLSLAGVLLAVGIVVADLGGPLAALAYAVVVGGLLLVAAARARAAAAPPPGRTCTCCTSTVHDPVEVR